MGTLVYFKNEQKFILTSFVKTSQKSFFFKDWSSLYRFCSDTLNLRRNYKILSLKQISFWKRFFHNFCDIKMILFCVQTKDTEASLLNKGSCLAQVLGVTKFINIRDIILVALCCATQVWLRCSTNPPQRPVCWTKAHA